MKYNGKLYGKVGGIYFDTGLTSNDWDELESKANLKWKSIKEKKPKDGEKVIIWVNNLSDPESSRHYCGVYYESNDGSWNFVKPYPISNITFKSSNDYIQSDLEGDKIQLTHWISLPDNPNI